MNNPLGTCDGKLTRHVQGENCVNWRPYDSGVSSPKNPEVTVSRFDNLPVAQKDKAWTWWFDQTPEQRKERIITMMRQEEELKQSVDLMKAEAEVRASVAEEYRKMQEES